MTFYTDGDMSAANRHANTWWDWELQPGRKGGRRYFGSNWLWNITLKSTLGHNKFPKNVNIDQEAPAWHKSYHTTVELLCSYLHLPIKVALPGLWQTDNLFHSLYRIFLDIFFRVFFSDIWDDIPELGVCDCLLSWYMYVTGESMPNSKNILKYSFQKHFTSSHITRGILQEEMEKVQYITEIYSPGLLICLHFWLLNLLKCSSIN